MGVTAIPGGAAMPLHEMFGHYAEVMRRAEAPGWNEWLAGADGIPRQVITRPSPLQAKILAAFGVDTSTWRSQLTRFDLRGDVVTKRAERAPLTCAFIAHPLKSGQTIQLARRRDR
jgi:hypothetical protein